MTVRALRSAALATAITLAACAHPAPPPAPVLGPTGPTVRPHSATGTYDLATTLRRAQPAPPPRRGRNVRTVADTTALLQLQYQQLAAPDPEASSSTQLAAVIRIPGYTEAPRGRAGQAAIWWPLPGDSVVVHFQPARAKGVMELRGAMQGNTISGDIWFTSSETGSSYQVGLFTAVKKRT